MNNWQILLIPYYQPVTILGSRDVTVSKTDKNTCSHETYTSLEKNSK